MTPYALSTSTTMNTDVATLVLRFPQAQMSTSRNDAAELGRVLLDVDQVAIFHSSNWGAAGPGRFQDA